jgi:hypothetical protein
VREAAEQVLVEAPGWKRHFNEAAPRVDVEPECVVHPVVLDLPLDSRLNADRVLAWAAPSHVAVLSFPERTPMFIRVSPIVLVPDLDLYRGGGAAELGRRPTAGAAAVVG